VAWLSAAYGGDGVDDDHLEESLSADAPVWIGLGPNVKARRPLSTDAIADVWAKRLGTSKIHATRHSFADGMNRIGAPITAIQARLGHNSLATTSVYLPALQSAENPYAEQLAAHVRDRDAAGGEGIDTAICAPLVIAVGTHKQG